MGQITRMLRLINLFCHRKVVTIEAMRETCGIPKRTAFRYLTTLSEENIPVFFDKALGGYRLAHENRYELSDLDLHHAVLMITCFRIAQRHVNQCYRDEIDDLVSRLIPAQEYAVEELDSMILGAESPEPGVPDYSVELTLALVNAAVLMGKKLEVTTTSNAGTDQRAIYENPNLVFQQEWRMGHRRTSCADAKSIESIAKVRIL
jgi:predicted DNA-binding transcriptional regulator YafY